MVIQPLFCFLDDSSLGSNDGALEGIGSLAADIVGNSAATLPLTTGPNFSHDSLHLTGATVGPGPNLHFSDALAWELNYRVGISLCA